MSAPSTEGTSLKLVVTLGISGLLSGLALVVTYEQTLPMIEANKQAALQAAVFRVLPGATAMQRWEAKDGALVAAPTSKGSAIYSAYGEGGKFIGYAIPSIGPGFVDNISLLYGYDPAKKAIIGSASTMCFRPTTARTRRSMFEIFSSRSRAS